MQSDHLIVITGGPGSGKTTLIDALEAAGFARTHEAGRGIIQDQAAIGGEALPWRDPPAFAEQMLAWDMRSYRMAQAQRRRGVLRPRHSRHDRISAADEASRSGPHGQGPPSSSVIIARVFIAPPWRDIFAQDAERRQDFAEAERTYQAMAETYTAARL